MRFLGLEITRAKAAPPTGLLTLPKEQWLWPSVREPFAGAWQRNIEARPETVLAFHAVYACVTLIAQDVSKCRLRLVEQDRNGIWTEVSSPAFSPVLRRPNRYQNRIKFIENWVRSKLVHGNTYVLKGRDERGVVVALYILDPLRTRPMVTPDGAVWYQLSRDNLTGVDDSNILVPQSEIIHDMMTPMFHPLCGVSPLTACGLPAVMGLAIQNNSSAFFENGSRPGGILTAPGPIPDTHAGRLKEYWEQNFTGRNAGKVAVLGDGLKYEQMTMSSTDAQLIEQLKWTGETVCSTFHVPAYKIGVGQAPTYNNIEALDQQYYSQCLQTHIENIELCLDEGLGLDKKPEGRTLGTEFDLDDLLRMDTATQIDALAKAVKGAIMTPNAALKKLNQAPVEGGDTIFMQEQNYSLAALAKRDAQDDPFASKATTATPAPAPAASNDNATEEEIEAAKNVARWKLKSLLSTK